MTTASDAAPPIGDRQATGPNPVFVARGLCESYGSGDATVHALRDLDLDIMQGEFVVLLGPSGSGKSALLNILGGLDAPTAGRAAWRGYELRDAQCAWAGPCAPCIRS